MLLNLFWIPNPLKIKPPIADFLYPPRWFEGLNLPKIKPPFEFLTPKDTDAESGFENGTTYLRKVRKNKTKMVPFEKSARIL